MKPRYPTSLQTGKYGIETKGMVGTRPPAFADSNSRSSRPGSRRPGFSVTAPQIKDTVRTPALVYYEDGPLLVHSPLPRAVCDPPGFHIHTKKSGFNYI